MRTRAWAIFIAVNIIVSATVMLTILFVWERIHSSATPTPVPVSTLLAPEDSASPLSVPSIPSPRPPEHTTYTVQAGDTLGAIAQTYDVSIEDLMATNGISDPNLLHVGQILVIPLGPSTPTAGPPAESTPEPPPTQSLPTLLPTATASGPPSVEIGQVVGAGDLASEVVVVRNLGGMVSLEGWILSDAEGNTFTLPTITLFPDAQIRVHSTPGRSTPSDLFWGREIAAWNSGELITLRDAAGNVVDTYIVP